MSVITVACSFCLGVITLRFLQFLGVVKATRRLKFALLKVVLMYTLLALAWKNYELNQNITGYVLMAELSRDAALETESLSAAMELDLEDSQDQLREAIEEIARLRQQVGTGDVSDTDKEGTSGIGSSGNEALEGGKGAAVGAAGAGGEGGIWRWLVSVLGSDSGGTKGNDSVCAYRGPQDALRALERHPKYRQLQYLLRWGAQDRAREDRLRRDLSMTFHPDKNRGCTSHILTEVNERINSFRDGGEMRRG